MLPKEAAGCAGVGIANAVRQLGKIWPAGGAKVFVRSPFPFFLENDRKAGAPFGQTPLQALR